MNILVGDKRYTHFKVMWEYVPTGQKRRATKEKNGETKSHEL